MIWLLGLILMLIGLFLVFLTLFQKEERLPEKLPEFKEESRVEKKYGGVVLIGPLPIVFGETRLAIVALILTIILMLLSFAFIFGWFT
ncbi:MAG: TIGR00304 family protein [Archaeoglobaceae archaeon]|nr:TIGR00304 family protein [Archaeoglobaceae archaeon]MDW8128311.1 TIGR00304 family protein [Archaeoglobaceae archaeon]